ncbi:putative transmembrane region and signal peptide protein [Rhodopirellula islandica]|uniref:Transmembrane region and signal peptide protein n=1 Tax=Rhodopirellula islandica TaxID=595434 RepID=A0A0J1BLN9_RHOIS|nr:putative transmembrane region and signal peptide protein [Rhodopirellula islandica]
MNISPRHFDLGRGSRMMSFIMLFLLAFPTLGISTTVSRSLLGNGRQTETEEIEERVPCSPHRRVQQLRSPQGGFVLPRELLSGRNLVPQTRPLLSAIDGHRIANGLLAPMRC